MKRMLTTHKVQAAAGTLAVGAAVAVAAFSGAPALANTHAQAAAGGVLSLESSPVGQANGFNPFAPTSASSIVGATSLIYEPLFQTDALKPAVKPYPFLATAFKWGHGGKSITFTIRKGVKWSDGTAFGPADVAFTYNLIKNNPKINNWGLTISKVSTSGDNVTLSFPTPQYANFQQIAAMPYIVPQHVWASAGDPSTYAATTPVGTGPYKVQSVGASGLVLTANTGYWGGPFGHGVPVKTVEFPTLSSNTSALGALLSDQVQWAGNFFPGFQKAAAGHPLEFNSPANNTNSLEPNLGEWPTNQLAVRQAISLAIDRKAISDQGEGGYEGPVTSATGITQPVFSASLAPSLKNMKLNVTAEPKAAENVLKQAGYKKVGKYFALHGKVVKLTLTDPSAYSDYAADDALVANELQKAGIDATYQGLATNEWNSDMATGNFQLTMHWSQTSTSAFQEYNEWLNSALATKANRAGNFEGLKAPAIDAALTKAASAATQAAVTSDLMPVEKYVADNLPIIPTVYGVAWGEYNTGDFSGWPTPSNLYESAQPAAPTNEVVILHLRPKS